VVSEKRWVKAVDLKPAYRFLTADNRSASVTGTRSWSGVQKVHNFTVDGLHTYFVASSKEAAPLLVHNEDKKGADGCDDQPGVSVKQVKMALGRAGMSVRDYDIVHVPKLQSVTASAYGNSPHNGLGEPFLGPRGRPLIEISNMGLADMKTAVETIFHEISHHQFYRLRGNSGDEEDPEAYGKSKWREFSRKTKRSGR
jgi:hypothetical protein